MLRFELWRRMHAFDRRSLVEYGVMCCIRDVLSSLTLYAVNPSVLHAAFISRKPNEAILS